MPSRNRIEVEVVLKDALTKAWTGMTEQFGRRAAQMVESIPRVAMEMVQLGAQVEAAEARFTGFAGGADKAEAFLAAFNRGAENTVDRMNAMAKSSKLLQMGLVTTTDEMETIAEMAIKLGNQTMDAKDRIDDFSLMLANQAVLRLDNFGISSGRVRDRIQELQESGQALNREQAFKMAVMEEGAKSLDMLGNTSELATTKMNKLSAAVEDAKQGFAEMATETAIEFLDKLGNVDEIGARIRQVPETFSQLVMIVTALWQSLEGVRDFMVQIGQWTPPMLIINWFKKAAINTWNLLAPIMKLAGIEMPKFEDSLTGVLAKQDVFTEYVEEATEATKNFTNIPAADFLGDLAYATVIAGDGVKRYTVEVDDAMRAEQKRLSQADAQKKAMQEQNRLMYEAGEAQKEYAKRAAEAARLVQQKLKEQTIAIKGATLAWNMGFTDYYKDVAESQAKYEEEREALLQEHQENIIDLEKRGQATMIKIDAGAHEEKLRKLRQSLQIALLEQGAYTDKTGEATRLRKENQIAELESQIAQEAKLLDDYRAGRLIKAGENVSELIEQEKGFYAEKLAGLEAAQEAEELAQRQSLGRMLLQQFQAWAQMRGIAAEEVIKMSFAIAEEYGLIEETAGASVGAMLEMWEKWANGLETDINRVADTMDRRQESIQRYKDSLVELAGRTYTVQVVEHMEKYGSKHTTSGETPGAAGEGLATGYDGLVGGPWGAYNFQAGEEGHPERVRVEPVTTNNFNMTVNTGATSPTVQQDFATMQALLGV